MIAGLYPYARGGITRPPRRTLAEIPVSLVVNPRYRESLTVLAGDRASADRLEGFGLRVARVFDDAPAHVRRDAAHLMKHWMCRWALAEFGEFLWIDWDTVCLREPDEAFWSACRATGTPRFIRIPNYWATVNCGVYYAPGSWATAMDESFGMAVEQPNDELLWRAVLPGDVVRRPDFWWDGHAVNIWEQEDAAAITSRTYFAHVRRLRWAGPLRAMAGSHAPGSTGVTCQSSEARAGPRGQSGMTFEKQKRR